MHQQPDASWENFSITFNLQVTNLPRQEPNGPELDRLAERMANALYPQLLQLQWQRMQLQQERQGKQQQAEVAVPETPIPDGAEFEVPEFTADLSNMEHPLLPAGAPQPTTIQNPFKSIDNAAKDPENREALKYQLKAQLNLIFSGPKNKKEMEMTYTNKMKMTYTPKQKPTWPPRPKSM